MTAGKDRQQTEAGMMRCDECKFWDRSAGTYRDISDLGECRKAVPMWDATAWNEEKEGYQRELRPEYAGQKMFCQDGSDYCAILLTKPDFFCAHYLKL